MKGLLTYPRIYPEGMNFLWNGDERANIEDNDNFTQRCKYIHSNGNGRFSAVIPLSHVFGFCEHYDKIMYGAKHEITLYRTEDDDAIYRSNEKVSAAEDAADKFKRGKINLTKISWKMPIVKLSDQTKIDLYKDISNKTVLPIEYLNRQCESIQLNAGQRQMDWQLSTGSVTPRFVVLAFQRARLNRDTTNSAVFDNLNLQNAHIKFNGERYPEHDLDLDLDNGKYITSYHTLTEFYTRVMGRESCPIRVRDFKNQYPLFVFDISRQRERIKDSPNDIRIKATFSENIPLNSFAYALILSDCEIQMQSDGNGMHIIQ